MPVGASTGRLIFGPEAPVKHDLAASEVAPAIFIPVNRIGAEGRYGGDSGEVEEPRRGGAEDVVLLRIR